LSERACQDAKPDGAFFLNAYFLSEKRDNKFNPCKNSKNSDVFIEVLINIIKKG
jgi:hypothetical protein